MSDIKVYKANYELYEGWGISEVGKSSLDLPEDFIDYDQFFVLKSDHDSKVKLLEAALEVAKDGQVNMYNSEWSGGEADTEKFRIELNKEIDAILNPKKEE
jgi:hypothetical protein